MVGGNPAISNQLIMVKQKSPMIYDRVKNTSNIHPRGDFLAGVLKHQQLKYHPQNHRNHGIKEGGQLFS